MGRTAPLGSGQAPQLFEVARYRSVLQMPPAVTVRLRDEGTRDDLLAALYPCGSLIGAGKRRTLEIIGVLDTAARGYYTDALGWFVAATAGHHLGNFFLSVPVRSLQLQVSGTDAGRTGKMAIGAGLSMTAVLPPNTPSTN